MSDEYPQTVVEWTEPNGVTYRIQIKPRPGSAHWSIMKDARLPDSDDWQRLAANEAIHKPTFSEAKHE